jgi:hypothetical protein
MGLPARIFGPALVATGPATVFTAAANERVRQIYIWVSNPTASAVNFTASIGADAAGTRIIGTNATVGNIPANSTQQFGPFVMHPSEILTVSASTNNVLNASGYGDRNLVS